MGSGRVRPKGHDTAFNGQRSYRRATQPDLHAFSSIYILGTRRCVKRERENRKGGQKGVDGVVGHVQQGLHHPSIHALQYIMRHIVHYVLSH